MFLVFLPPNLIYVFDFGGSPMDECVEKVLHVESNNLTNNPQ